MESCAHLLHQHATEETPAHLSCAAFCPRCQRLPLLGLPASQIARVTAFKGLVLGDVELEQRSDGSTYESVTLSEVQASFVGLAELRVSNAAKLRRRKSPLPIVSQAPVKDSAMLVVRRASDRARQVQVAGMPTMSQALTPIIRKLYSHECICACTDLETHTCCVVRSRC